MKHNKSNIRSQYMAPKIDNCKALRNNTEEKL